MKFKKSQNELAKKWIAEMEERKNSTPLFTYNFGFKKAIVVIWWTIFNPMKSIYFMQRCIDGMYHVPAYDYAKRMSKHQLLTYLKNTEWL